MAWKQPLLTDPPMGPTDEIRKLQHRLIYAYGTRSQAVALGVTESGIFDAATDAALRNIQAHLAATEDPKYNRESGVLTYDCKVRLGVYIPPKLGPKYPIQGVWHNTNAFLQPDPYHSYVQATDEGAAEGLRLELPDPRPKVVFGYSMGGDTTRKFLERWPAERRGGIKAVITFGDPSMPPEGSLLGDDPGQGISGVPQPLWVRDRYWSFSIDGNWYPRSRGLMPFLYQILIRAALTLDFANFLFTQLPTLAGQVLLGQQPSNDPLFGVLSPLAGMVTTGPANVVGQLLNPMGLFAVLPELIELLFYAIKFVTTQAHGMYADPGHALWDGMTAVDKAAALVREHVPGGAVLILFPGTWSIWNVGFQFDVAARLQ